jgi:hypothetical protein
MTAQDGSQEDWTTVYQARDGWKSALAGGWLRDAGIPAVATNELPEYDAQLGVPSQPWSAVRVPASYRAQAERVLKEMMPEA